MASPFEPNRGWFLAAAGALAVWLLDKLEAPLWLAALTIAVFLGAALVWPLVETSSRRMSVFWTVLAVYAVSAAVTTYLTRNPPADSPPHVTLLSSGFKPDPQPDRYRSVIEMKNDGSRMATGLSVRIVAMQQDFRRAPSRSDPLDVVNDMPAGSMKTWFSQSMPINPGEPPMFFLFEVQCTDDEDHGKKKLSQVFWFKWEGRPVGAAAWVTAFGDASADDQARIRAFVRQHGMILTGER